MALPFSGPAVLLQPGDIANAARDLGCLPEAVEAVRTVETGGTGFLSDGSGRPRILFEAKVFGDLTQHRWDATYPLLSTRVNNWKLYRGGAAEYDRLREACNICAVSAVEATSWGLFQVLGSNATALGYPDALTFAGEMAKSEGCQLEAFVRFCKVNRLDAALRALDWAAFARGYNGPAYAVNQYDTKLAAAFAHARGNPGPYPRLGWTGDQVRSIQIRLNTMGFSCGIADGQFGRATELAVRRMQSMFGMTVDGVCGPATMQKLELVTR